MGDVSISLDASQLAATAKLFSSRVIQELAGKGKSPLFCRLAEESTLAGRIVGNAPIRELFELAFSFLTKKIYRHEYAYKAAITHKLLLGVHSLHTASLLTEFRVGSCKADIAILNGTSSVYEIKSERDRLDRLSAQIEAYRSVFANVNIIAAEKHVPDILCMVPEDVGILVLTERFRISTIREACSDINRLDATVIFDSITRREAVLILKMLNISVPSVPNTRIHGELRAIFSSLPVVDTHACMVAVLKECRSLSSSTQFISALPSSLRTAALSAKLHPKDHQRLLYAVETPIGEALSWA
ncbi:sce7726 family protein [Paraburkholderia fungorum]|uniref:sce7726 family protein n=1 Tax=Paraburkholderia fungorum TaxID=134537 RepID=UPI0038BA085A